MINELKKRIYTSLALFLLMFLMFINNYISAYFLIILGILSLSEFFKINTIIFKKNKIKQLIINSFFICYIFLFCYFFILLSSTLHLKVLLFIILTLFTSCDPEYHSVGSNLLIDQAFETDLYKAPVYTYQNKLKRIQTDGLPLGQIGTINSSYFGESKASITSQLVISNNPTFGIYSQEQETSETTDVTIIPENETVTSVFLEIPFYSNQNDKDNDGVIDPLDLDPLDPSSDTDGDGLTDISENSVGTNPLSNDSDNDGILDNEDTDSSSYDAQNAIYDIDSIYGNLNAKFTMKVNELTYYLSSLDPNNNFETSQQFYSNTNYFDQGFYSSELFNDEIQLNYDELRFNYTENHDQNF